MKSQIILITKRDKTTAPLDIEKLHKVVMFACDGITGVSASQVELKSQIQFYNKMTTSTIQETLIKAAADLITEETPNYQHVAGRLINYHLRKQVYNSPEPIDLYSHVKDVADLGYYTKELLDWYTKDEFAKMDSFIDHSKDEDLTYAAMEQFRSKYLAKNRVTGEIFETPQMVYMLIAATLFHSYPERTRLKWVKDYYECISNQYISLPTPIMSGVRTTQKQFSSCVLIDTDDNLDSINSTASSIVKYVSRKAGIGINAGRIRSEGSPIRNGEAVHTGMLPFIKYFLAATKSCSQGGVRGGAATLHYPIWHLEFEDLVVLKNNKGTEDNRVRHMDYSVQISKLFYERLIKKEDITLFCPNDVPGLYDAFFEDQDKFKEIYERAERNTRIRKKKIPATELFGWLIDERKNTGRIYIMNVDHCNEHSSFIQDKAPVRMSNLCQEITLPTVPGTSLDDENMRIATCTLSAINWGKIDDPKDFKKPCELAVRSLDALLSYQDYPMKAAQLFNEDWRPLGIGVTNLAYFIAKNGLTYEGNKETFETIDEFTEAYSYYLIKASVDLAVEQGACKRSNDTKYGHGIFPVDTYKKSVDGIVKRKLSCDWKELKARALKFGIRNATLMALMPCETSSQILNSTNGIEPIKALVVYKESKDGSLAIVAPGFPRLKNKYQLLYDLKSPEGYLKIAAIIQKYVDQAISVNTSYNPEQYKDNKLSEEMLLSHILKHYSWGGKTLYYQNTKVTGNDGLTEDEISDTIQDDSSGCEDGFCKL